MSSGLEVTPGYLYTAGAIWPPVCAIIVGGRFATRRAQKASLGLDDWLALPGLILVCGMCAAMLAGTALRATGYPTPKVAPDQALTATSEEQTVTRKIYYTETLLQIAALTFIKLSCMLFYQRVFGKGVSKAINTAIWVFNGLIIIWGIGFFFGFLFICDTHFYYLWTTVENEAKCSNTSAINLGIAISDFIMDIIILAFPMPLIWRLQMSTFHKVAVSFVFALGAAAVAMSCTRMVIFINGLSVEFQKNADSDFVSTNALYFMLLEAAFALCAICLPTLSGALKLPGVRRFINSFQSSFSLSNSSRENTRGTGTHEREGFGTKLSRSTASRTTTTRGDGSNRERASFDLEMQPFSFVDGANGANGFSSTKIEGGAKDSKE